jgi:twitching motility protein PilT
VRQDPDIILVGEIRDLETVEISVNAALTGHLLLSTFHANDAATAIPRLLDMGTEPFLLSSTMNLIIAQRLVKTVDNGRTAAVEILVKNARIEALILEGREGEIPDAIKEGKDVYKTQTFDQALLALYAEGKISRENAIQASTSRNDITMALDFYDADKTQKETRKEEARVSIKELKEIDKDILGLKQ